MRELSIFVDESGSDGLSDRYYLLTVVMHDQSESIADSIAAYEGALRAKGLPDIPFHASPLMNGKDQYSGLDLKTRKMLLGSFRVFFRHMPVKYHTFAYATKQFASLDKLAGTMRRDLVNFLFDNLAELQSYDMVKVYYDNGQHSIAESQYEQSIVKGQVWPDPVFFGAWPYHLACFASSMDVSRPTRVFAV